MCKWARDITCLADYSQVKSQTRQAYVCTDQNEIKLNFKSQRNLHSRNNNKNIG